MKTYPRMLLTFS